MRILKESYDEAKRLLSENRDVMDKIAEFLIEKETITGKEFMKIFREAKGLPEPADVDKTAGEKLADELKAEEQEREKQNAEKAESETQTGPEESRKEETQAEEMQEKEIQVEEIQVKETRTEDGE